MNSKKVIIVGIDGGSFNVLNNFINDGIMPNLENIMRESSFGELDTYIEGPGQGWASFMTGKSPSKHGIYYWTTAHGINSDAIKDNKIWEILGENGLKCGIVNLSYTFPPKPINGFMISGLGAGLESSSDVIFSYPKSLIKEVISHCGGYIWGCQYADGAMKDYENLLRKIIKMTEYRTKACDYLLENYKPDFFTVVFRGVDLIQHAFWHYLDPVNSEFYEKGPIKDLINSYYSMLDEYIGKIWQRYSSAIKLIVSDHGFCGVKKLVNINEYLSQQAFLTKNYSIKSAVGNKYFLKIKKEMKPVYEQFFSKYKFFRELNKIRKKRMNKIDVAIDWQKTLIYLNSYGTDGLYFNKAIINSCDINKLKDDVYKRLINLKDDKTGDNVFKKVYFKEEMKVDKFYEYVPEIIWEVNEGFVIMPDISLEKNEVFESMEEIDIRFWTGDHKQYGIFIAGGDGIKSGYSVKEIKINDLFPTILNIYDVPVPDDVDGKILKEIFD
jgi:predicted AlkP superfamily phosphohydrolase/phosphomutase